jgi:hypothetical protein
MDFASASSFVFLLSQATVQYHSLCRVLYIKVGDWEKLLPLRSHNSMSPIIMSFTFA